MVGVAVFAAALVLCFPDAAFAWGPVTHLSHGASMLGDLNNLPAALQQLFAAERWAYLYGCIGADIVQVKRYTRSVYTHCHSWHVGWRVMQSARSDAERAFAWGYLSHLAADVYSHNYFVPCHLVSSFPSRTHRHIYWEARFDAQRPPPERRLLRDVAAHSFPECDALVERVVGRTFFSFRTNKRIFHSVVNLQQLDRWHTVLQRFTARSRFALSPAEVEHYQGLCVAAVDDLLQHGREAAILEYDPNGHESLRRAKRIVRKLRELERHGIPTVDLRRRFVEEMAALVAAGIASPSTA